MENADKVVIIAPHDTFFLKSEGDRRKSIWKGCVETLASPDYEVNGQYAKPLKYMRWSLTPD